MHNSILVTGGAGFIGANFVLSWAGTVGTHVMNVVITGAVGGAMAAIADTALCIPSKDTANVQEAHILCGHMLCDRVELSVCEPEIAKKEAGQR